ncbi:MAG: transporter substrate-binding domain-containing protein [Oscillospiraceae bacterium]|jgi:putative glutamine transport system substrate-binding protein|nr:transporter substrate-binding domain-containing protein [Oscillospiraceae bacterium]
MSCKKIAALLLALAMIFALAACGGTKTEEPASAGESGLPAQVQAIKDRGTLKIGCKEDVPNFGELDTATGTYKGLEIEIAKLLAKEIFGDSSKVSFQGVTAKTRGPLLDNSDVDMIIATFTITEERKLTYNFSDPYYQDAVGMLVKKDGGIASIADCDGKVIGVAQSATSRDALQAAADEAGVSVSFSEFGTYPEIQAALFAGNVDVFSVDRSILRGYLTDDLMLTDDKFSPQDYGVATKFENKELADWVNEKINGWLADGTIAQLVADFNL